MQALILVGGEGTRLRPLTSVAPKPVVTLVDRPFMAYMLEWLRGHGIDEAIMSLGFLADGIRAVLGDGSDYGVKLIYVEEPEPLGTAGALKYAEEHLAERFVMLNGDVLTDLDLSAQIAQHEATGAKLTLGLIPVDDPSSYGLVRQHDDKSVKEFLEKPSADQIDTNNISAGVYVIEREVVETIAAGRNVSIEREVFPSFVGKGLYAYAHEAYWMDIGTPARYLEGSWDILERRVETAAGERGGENAVLIEDGATIADDATIGPRAIVQSGVTIGAGSVLEEAIVLEGATIGSDCILRNCVVAHGASIGDRTRVDGEAIVGKGARIGADNVISNGARVFPGVEIPDGGLKF